MKTIEVTLDDTLLDDIDRAIDSLHLTRVEFIQTALELALQKPYLAWMEKRHAEGYAQHPVREGEFDGWESEQVWGNE